MACSTRNNYVNMRQWFFGVLRHQRNGILVPTTEWSLPTAVARLVLIAVGLGRP